MSNLWMNFWQFTLIAALLVYGLVTVRIAIGGWHDLWEMLKGLEHLHDKNSDQS